MAISAKMVFVSFASQPTIYLYFLYSIPTIISEITNYTKNFSLISEILFFTFDKTEHLCCAYEVWVNRNM